MTEVSKASLLELLAPITDALAAANLDDPDALKATLDARFPAGGERFEAVRALLRKGVENGTFAERENAGIRFGRVRKAEDENALGVECVHMDQPGPGHTHPTGEVDLCFAVSGRPSFDGHPEGWVVYGPGSWHVPTVAGGAMDILYFLPGGQIRFEAKPE
ncbi:MAG: DUF4863 family protein [Myxococcota bacterium]